jgi:hypothetical protein
MATSDLLENYKPYKQLDACTGKSDAMRNKFVSLGIIYVYVRAAVFLVPLQGGNQASPPVSIVLRGRDLQSA